MSNKKKFALKVATLLIAFAAAIPFNSCVTWLGEADLPKEI